MSKYIHIDTRLPTSVNKPLLKDAVLLAPGASLYRVAPRICDYTPANISTAMRTDTNETRKTGVYFGTYPFIALGIVNEYNKDLEFGVFRTSKPIFAAKGKYMHDDFVSTTQPIGVFEHLNHYDPYILPLVFLSSPESTTYDIQFVENEETLQQGNGEFFVGDANDLAGIHLVETWHVSKDRLNDFLLQHKENCTQLPLQAYIDAGVLTPVTCSNELSGGVILAQQQRRRITPTQVLTSPRAPQFTAATACAEARREALQAQTRATAACEAVTRDATDALHAAAHYTHRSMAPRSALKRRITPTQLS